MSKGVAFIIKFRGDFEVAQERLLKLYYGLGIDNGKLPEFISQNKLIYTTGNKCLLLIVPYGERGNPGAKSGQVKGLVRSESNGFKIVGGEYLVEYGLEHDGEPMVKVLSQGRLKLNDRDFEKFRHLGLANKDLSYDPSKKIIYLVLKQEDWG